MDWHSPERNQETKMSQNEDGEFIEIRREVIELMGRCILNLQKYELGMKQFLATSEISGNASKGLSNLAQRRKRYSGRTLGQLIGEFTGDYVSPDTQQDRNEELDSGKIGDSSAEAISFQMRFSVRLSEEKHAELTENLRELVTLRNDLVHHFLSRHPLSDLADCIAAKKYLIESLELINHHIKQLHEFGSNRESMKESLATFLKSEDFSHFITYGFSPGQPIDWAQTPVVGHLKAAEIELQNEGWTELFSAINWIRSQAPHLSPKPYQCRSWRALLRASSLFEIRKEQLENGTTKVLYRSL
ncbi:hypothetical protein FMN52_02060 [Marinobacter sp. BW6]|nr:hypothetical protein FMN52_02060 [Marinobacter sp. BW6]